MYLPPHFAENRPEALHRIIRDHPLGMLVTYGDTGLDADHLPFEIDTAKGEHGTLLAHVARANPLWQRCPTGTPVMIAFRGEHSYISPNWYPGKHETHKLVPTWNYVAVHAHGVMTVHDDERYVRRVVALLTRRHEAGEPQPWKMGDTPADHLDSMLANIVGIEIAITRLEGKFKLSQNRETRDVLGAARVLETRGEAPLAEAMRAALPIGPTDRRP